MLRVLLVLFGLGLAGNVSAASLTGLWVGYFVYEGGIEVPMSVVFEQLEEKFLGEMIEPQTSGREMDIGRRSLVAGTIRDFAVEFEKTYYADVVSHAPFERKPGVVPVKYKMVLSDDGNELTGFWTVGDSKGRAEFRRVTPGKVDRM